MIIALIIFYSSLVLIALMVFLKQLEQNGGVKILARFSATAEPVVKKIADGTKHNLTGHLNIRRLGLLTILTLRTIEKFLLSAQIKTRRLNEILQEKFVITI